MHKTEIHVHIPYPDRIVVTLTPYVLEKMVEEELYLYHAQGTQTVYLEPKHNCDRICISPAFASIILENPNNIYSFPFNFALELNSEQEGEACVYEKLGKRYYNRNLDGYCRIRILDAKCNFYETDMPDGKGFY